MSNLIALAIVAIVFLILIRLIFGKTKASSYGASGSGSPLADTMSRQLEAHEMMRFHVADFRKGLETGKIAIRNDRDLAYYLGYLKSLSNGQARRKEITHGESLLAAVWIEAARLKLGLDGEVSKGREIFETLSRDADFATGVTEGKLDIDYAIDPSNPAPYWRRLLARLSIRHLSPPSREGDS